MKLKLTKTDINGAYYLDICPKTKSFLNKYECEKCVYMIYIDVKLNCVWCDYGWKAREGIEPLRAKNWEIVNG